MSFLTLAAPNGSRANDSTFFFTVSRSLRGMAAKVSTYSDDMADACVFLMQLPDAPFSALLGSDETVSGRFEPPLVNIGVGHDCHDP